MNNKNLYKIIKDRFDYRDGKLFYKNDVGKKMKAGSEAGNFGVVYSFVCINSKKYLLHRIIYLWHHGSVPKSIDHINNDPLDNRIENLRPASSSQNNHNRSINKNSTTGVKGVYWNKSNGKYLARIRKNNKFVYAKYFDCLEEAKMEIEVAREKIHGQFANHG